MTKSATQRTSDPIADALHAVTAGESQNKQLPVDSDHVEHGAQKFTKAEITANTPAAKPSPAAAPATDAPRLKRKLPVTRMQIQGYLHNAFDVTVERGVILQDVLDTDFWVHVASQLKPHDQVTVICEDGTWFARLLVISADRLWAKMYKLEYHDLTASYANMPKTQEEEYDVTWSAIGKYAIVKKNQHGQPALKDGFQTKLEAYQWLDGHLKTLNC